MSATVFVIYTFAMGIMAQVNEDPCQGGTLCGLNGICELTSGNEPNCTCPPGFDFVDNQNASRGCRRISTEQICGANSKIETLNNINWPGGDYSVQNDTSEEGCKKACIDDCNCIVAIYTTTKELCWKKQMPLQHGQNGADNTLALVKVPISSGLPPNKGNTNRRLVVGIILLACFSVLWVVGLLVVCFYRFSPNANSRVLQDQHKSIHEGLNSFTYKEIQTATGGFKEELGRGACSRVHKGRLSDGRLVAVKSIHESAVEQGRGENEFVTEVEVIGLSHHRNLIRLYGFCFEGSHRLLVYEYMSNGSLERPLFEDSGFLDWRLRVQIATEIARGIMYLHEECVTQILHCDIKPQNILLDENYSAKVSDFGLAKLMSTDQTRTYTLTRGTPSYIAPEWHRNLPITAKVDVYSFGVMLLEMICCRKSVKLDAAKDEIVFLEWIYDCFEAGQLFKLVERQSQGNAIEQRELEKMVLIGVWCSQEDPSMRPSMKRIVHMLEGIVEIPVPPPRKFN